MDNYKTNTQCAVSGCWRPAIYRGQYCERHDGINERTGSPTGRTILKRDVRRYEQMALEFIARNRDHPGIQSGLEWFDKFLVLGAKRGTKPITSQQATPWQRALVWFGELHRQGVSSEQLLATMIAVYMLREVMPAMFAEDTIDKQRHFYHQLVNRLLRHAKGKRVRGANGDKWTYPGGEPTVGLKQMLGVKLLNALGLLAGRAAKHIVDGEIVREETTVPGSSSPFISEDERNR